MKGEGAKGSGFSFESGKGGMFDSSYPVERGKAFHCLGRVGGEG